MRLRMCAAAAAVALTAAMSVVSAPAALAAPFLPAAVPFDATWQVDVDGDGKGDTFKVTFWSITSEKQTWQVKVSTAKGVRSTTYWNTKPNVYFPAGGFSSIDGVKGKDFELIYDEAYDSGGTRQWVMRVLSWRSNKLVAVRAPWSASASSNESKNYLWTTSTVFPVVKDGFRYFTSNGRRYAEHFMLEWFESDQRWKGTIRKSKWASGRWYNVRKRTVILTDSQADKYVPLPIGD